MTRRATDYKVIDAEVNRVFSQYDSDEMADMLFKGKCIYGRINDFEVVANHPRVRHHRTIVNTSYANGVTFRVLDNPTPMSDLERETDYTTTELGENTFEVPGEVTDQETLYRLFDPVLEKATEVQKAIYSKSE